MAEEHDAVADFEVRSGQVGTLLAMESAEPPAVAFGLLRATGRPWGELAGLVWADVDWLASRVEFRRTLGDDGLIRCPRAGNVAPCPLDWPQLRALEALRRWNEEHGAGVGPSRFLFVNLAADGWGTVPIRPAAWERLFGLGE